MPLIPHIKGGIIDVEGFIGSIVIRIAEGLVAKQPLPITTSAGRGCKDVGGVRIKGLGAGQGLDPGGETELTVTQIELWPCGLDITGLVKSAAAGTAVRTGCSCTGDYIFPARQIGFGSKINLHHRLCPHQGLNLGGAQAIVIDLKFIQ